MFYCCCIRSKRRKKRGLPVVGDKASKDGKKVQTVGKVGETTGKDKAVTSGKTVDVRKSHETENMKSTVTSQEVRAEGAVAEQGDASLDDRSSTHLLPAYCLYSELRCRQLRRDERE